MFIHYSHSNKIQENKDPDSIQRIGINVDVDRHGNRSYVANDHVQFKSYKTLRGAQNFMEKHEYKPIAIDDDGKRIFLNEKLAKANMPKQSAKQKTIKNERQKHKNRTPKRKK